MLHCVIWPYFQVNKVGSHLSVNQCTAGQGVVCLFVTLVLTCCNVLLNKDAPHTVLKIIIMYVNPISSCRKSLLLHIVTAKLNCFVWANETLQLIQEAAPKNHKVI